MLQPAFLQHPIASATPQVYMTSAPAVVSPHSRQATSAALYFLVQPKNQAGFMINNA
jgi:hypothetical protein